MDGRNNISFKHNSTSIDGKQIIWITNSHMKSEPLKRREQMKQVPRLKQKQNIYETHDLMASDTRQTKDDLLLMNVSNEYGSLEQRDKKQIGIVKPILTVEKEKQSWNCSELEKLHRRFSELIDGKVQDDKTFPKNRNALVERIQSLYSSMGSHLYLSPCIIRLFVLTDIQVCSLEQWKLIHRGYPLWLYNTGLNPRRSCELRLIIVDEKTGFILWSDRITSVKNVLQPTSLALSFRHSSNTSSVMIRFESTDEKYFTRFHSYLKQNEFYSENSSKRKISRRFIKKSDISPPCHFKHLTHMDNNLTDIYKLQN